MFRVMMVRIVPPGRLRVWTYTTIARDTFPTKWEAMRWAKRRNMIAPSGERRVFTFVVPFEEGDKCTG